MSKSFISLNPDGGADYTTVRCVPDHLVVFRHHAVAISERSDAFVERRFSAYNRAMYRASRLLGDVVAEEHLITGIFSRDLRSCSEKVLVKKKMSGPLSASGLQLASSCGRLYMFPGTLKSVVLPQALERLKASYNLIYAKGEALEAVRDAAFAETTSRKERLESVFESAFEEARLAAGNDHCDLGQIFGKGPVNPQGLDLSGYASGLKAAVTSFFKVLRNM